MKNKSGEGKIFSIWWVLAVFAVVGFIVLGVNVFYSAEYDSRLSEANILNNHLAECLINLGSLEKEFKEVDFNKTIYSFCNLEKNLFGENSDYFFRINISKDSDRKIYGGRRDYEEYCETYLKKKGQGAETFPNCVLKRENVIYEGENYILEILTGSNNKGEKEVVFNG